MTFNELGLCAELANAVSSKGYSEPTPIQAKAIPSILEGRDLLGGSQTGTGKTAAFTLPMLQLLDSRKPAQEGRDFGRGKRPGRPRALVLTPTRELAAQVGASVEEYGKGLRLRSTVIFGGVGINPQIDRLRRGVEVLVATPGRLLDHASQGTLDLGGVEILILDEADRMLDMGFIHDIKKVLNLLPKRRQNLLFSATYSDEIKRLADGLLDNPVLVEVARKNTTAETVEQFMHPVAKADKRILLSRLIREGDWQQVLVFTRTKHGANRLAKQLEEDGVSSAAIHGNKSQSARTKALADFKSGKIRMLAATDVASRGIDISRLPHVVNFELPNVPEDYVHRIGRTGRAGEEGIAYSLVSADERSLLRDIEKLLQKPIPVKKIEGFDMDPEDGKEDAKNVSRGRGRGGRGGGRGRSGGGGGDRRGGGGRSSGGGGGNRSGGGGGGNRRSGGGNRNRSRQRSASSS
ncbi:DEAD/DEAH box helicase [Verrucomicrobiales bacterium BCK34]|nr:DEAD/DEAH box helicase [Verrucomicrobiales bacterium BCK34]